MRTSKKIIIYIGIALALFLAYFYFKEEKIIIVETVPQNNQQNVLDNQKITVRFSKQLTQKQTQQISINATPPITTRQDWSNNQTLIINPQNPLEKNTTYKIEVFQKSSPIHSFLFTTNVYSSIELAEQIKTQISDDLDYGFVRQKISENYPWYDHLPIRNPNYIIVFSFEDNHFRVHPSQPINESQKNTLITTIIEELKGINAPTDKYDIVIINPNN